MTDSFYFRGFGSAVPHYRVTPVDLDRMVSGGYLGGFSSDKIASKPEFKEFIKNCPDETSTTFFIRSILGFGDRYHVAPFPPNDGIDPLISTVDLASFAVKEALDNSGLSPSEISLMIISSTTPPTVSPGIAELVRDYSIPFNCNLNTISVVAGCGGFIQDINLALKAMSYDSKINNVVIAHTETMSRLLTKEKNLITHATCGDGAAAAVISRIPSVSQMNECSSSGIYGLTIFQDPRFSPYLYVTEDHSLFIDTHGVGVLAVENMVKASNDAMSSCHISIKDVDLFIPHQTGNKILDRVAERLGIGNDKTYKLTQERYSNISGATIPMSLCDLSKEGKILSGQTILCAATGVGGISGAFIYKVPDEDVKKKSIHNDREPILKNKVAVVTGATGSIGTETAKELARKGASLILTYSSSSSENSGKTESLTQMLTNLGAQNIYWDCCDFKKPGDIAKLGVIIDERYTSIDYLIHCAGIPGPVGHATSMAYEKMRDVTAIDYEGPRDISLSLIDRLSTGGQIVYLGSLAQDHCIPGSAPYVASKEALRSFAASASNELNKKGIRSVFLMPGVVDSGMSSQLTDLQISAATSLFGQHRPQHADEIARTIVEGLYMQKVSGTHDSYNNNLIIRRFIFDPFYEL